MKRALLLTAIDRYISAGKLCRNSRLPYHKSMFFSSIHKRVRELLAALCISFLIASQAHAQTNAPRIVVSIKPLHSIVSQITLGVTQPALLLEQEASAHHFQLRPSQQQKISQAELFIYSSEQIESFVEKQNQQGDTEFIRLASLESLQLLGNRDFHHQHNGHDEDQHSTQHSIDGHIWLSISNAIAISNYLKRLLSERDPAHQAQYQANTSRYIQQLNRLRDDNQKKLADYSQQAFLVYHDAYQYFEKENNLQGAHFITSSPDINPGIRRVQYLIQLIRKENIRCVFYEPPNIPPLVETISENQPVQLVPLDPIGALLDPGADHYVQLMQQTANQVYHCLSTTNDQ
jgi:zinc transport system substrate-binding protein